MQRLDESRAAAEIETDSEDRLLKWWPDFEAQSQFYDQRNAWLTFAHAGDMGFDAAIGNGVHAWKMPPHPHPKTGNAANLLWIEGAQ